MRILHLLDSLDMGGKEVFTVGLAAAQKDAGHDVGIATFDPGNAFVEELAVKGIPHFQHSRKGPLDLRLVAALRRLLISRDAELLHCHAENPSVYGALALAFLPRIPLVVTLHSGDRGAIPFRHKLEHTIAYYRADRIVCVAPAQMETVTKREFAPARKTMVLFNGVVKPPGGGQDAQEFRGELGLEAGTLVIACIGRLHPVKNHLRFLEAFALARGRMPAAVLALVGDGPLRPETEKKVADLGLTGSVRMLGLRKDVGRILAAADIYALPSLNEGHSISLLEACSHGKAVLASRRGGNPDIVVDGLSGVLTDPEDVPALAESLVRLAADAGLRQRLGKDAEARFLDRFSMDTCAKQYEAVYREASASRSRRFRRLP